MPLPDLILIPTCMERDQLLRHPGLRGAIASHKLAVELCGFGPIAAAASTARLLASGRVRRLLLAGIAGSYDATLPVGSAWQFGQVGCWGIGVGSGPDFRCGYEFGWSQLPGGLTNHFPAEILPLFQDTAVPRNQHAGLALTCTTSASSTADCTSRRLRFPTATAEEMEGFGMALACLDHQCQTGAELSFGMIRGIANQAGDRDKSGWQIAAALDAVAELLLQILSRESVTGQELTQ